MPRTVIRLGLAVGLAALPFAATAETQLERMERISSAMTDLTFQGMIEQMPALEGNLPSVDWDDAMRAASECVLDEIRDLVGDDGIDEMLENMESDMADATPAGMIAGEYQPAPPAGITNAQIQTVSTDCGVVEAMVNRMAASGAMSIMMDPN